MRSRAATTRCVGTLGLRIAPDPHGNVGYWIGRPYWGQRLRDRRGARGASTARVLAPDLAWLTATHLARNRASARVLAKCGMREVRAHDASSIAAPMRLLVLRSVDRGDWVSAPVRAGLDTRAMASAATSAAGTSAAASQARSATSAARVASRDRRNLRPVRADDRRRSPSVAPRFSAAIIAGVELEAQEMHGRRSSRRSRAADPRRRSRSTRAYPSTPTQTRSSMPFSCASAPCARRRPRTRSASSPSSCVPSGTSGL